MHVVLPLTKGHLSNHHDHANNMNKDRFFLAEGVSLLEGNYCTSINHHRPMRNLMFERNVHVHYGLHVVGHDIRKHWSFRLYIHQTE